MFLYDHVAEVDADAEPDAPFLGHLGLAVGHPSLDFESTSDGVNDARKLGQEAIAGILYDPAPVLRDLRVDQLPEMGLQPLMRALFVRYFD